MSKETLSMNEAKKIVTENQRILLACAKQMDTRNDEFVEQISHLWEDANAVKFAQSHKKNMVNFTDELKQNERTFAETVKEIADSYAKVGGIAMRLAIAPITLVPVFDISKINEFFKDSANGDDFGFIDPVSGPDKVIEAWNALVADLNKYAAEAVNAIKAINAFGNVEVQLNLAQSAGKIVEILNSHIAESKKQVTDYVGKTAAGYAKVGSAATGAASLATK